MGELKLGTLTEAEVEPWASFLGRENRMDPGYFLRHYENDPDRCLNSIFVFRDGEKIVSSVRVFHRKCTLGGSVIPVGAIGEVCTDSGYRCRGLSRALLAEAVRYMEREKFPLSELRTRVDLQPHYAIHGYRRVIKNRLILEKPDVSGEKECLRPLLLSDYPQMAALYERIAPSYSMMAVRSPAYWQSWCPAELSHPTGLFREGQLMGYICYADNNVRELIAPPEMHDALLKAVQTEKTELDVPGFTVSRQRLVRTCSLLYTMVRVNSPFSAFGTEFSDTEVFADFLNGLGGTHALHADWY